MSRRYPAIAAVLFDLDGTLIDTTNLIFQSYQHAWRTEFAVDLNSDDLYVGYGQPLPASFRAILGRRDALPVDGSACRIGRTRPSTSGTAPTTWRPARPPVSAPARHSGDRFPKTRSAR